jgi:hypothetical protein
MPRDETPEKGVTANAGYAAFQIAKALTTIEIHADESTRDRAREKVNKWVSVLDGMISGRFAVGSRQPIQDVPVWATPEVVTGGFVTGRLLAGGPVQAHEEEQLSRLTRLDDCSDRQTLNAYFLSDTGLAEITQRLQSGCYDIAVPEEGALLVVAWLAANGHTEAARCLIDVLSPHFSTLRFYPLPTQRPLSFGTRVYLESVGVTFGRIQSIQPNPRIQAQREAVRVWTPLYDRMIGLFIETVSGSLPIIQPDGEGRWVSPETKKFNVVGGWPCQQYPAGWKERALQVWSDCERARQTYSLCGKAAKTKDSFAELRGNLKRSAEDPSSLTGRDVGKIRLILARHIAKRGGPDSEKFRQRQVRQAQQIAGPTFHEVAGVVQQRLASHPASCGLDTLDGVIQPVTDTEARQSQVPAGTAIPASMRRKISRCLCDTADILVERDIITSGETLAIVIPQFTSGLKAASFDDAKLRVLYAAIYRAFRRRRSLLLLNLEKQVRIEELPWIMAIEPFRRQDLSAREVSQRALKEVAMLTLRAFPQAIIPNKLLQELGALAKSAELKLPLVDELAADIFMDDFSPKFTKAAKLAADLLEGSLYARYFGLDCAAIRKLPDTKLEPKKSWFRRQTSNNPNPLVELCIARAGVDSADRWDVARNGMVIEQAQILTTQNLAVLFGALNLAEELRGELYGMVERCFRWICRRQQVKTDQWHAKLIMLKNTAYAWRQMVFYLSHLPVSEGHAFLSWAEGHLREQSEDFRIRFAPAFRGLVVAQAGRSLDDSLAQAEGARRFVGWTKTHHWILGDKPSAKIGT